MTRTQTISGVIFTSALLSLQGVSAAAKESKQPNILFISIDDLRTQLGAYGDSYMVTPTLDALAEDGRLFVNHYVQVPTSGASRAALLTGRYPTLQWHTNNHYLTKELIGSQEGEEPETFVHHLRRNGYYTVGMGKISHSPDGGTPHEGEYIAELPFSWDKFVTDPNTLWPRGDGLLHSYADGGSRYDKSGYNPVFEAREVEDTSYPDGRLADLATAQIEELANCDKPFFMAVGFYKPHLPFSAPKKYWDMYDKADIPLSPNREAPKGVSGRFLHDCAEFNNQYQHEEKAKAGRVLSDEFSRDLIHAYSAAVSFTDAQVGKVIAKLREVGLYDNTIIVVWGDHGWHLGDQTIWGKHTTFENALNSTFMIITPDMRKRGAATESLAATVDIYPTLCELAGIETPSSADGESLVPILKNPKAKVHEEVVSYWYNQMSLRSERYRMALYEKDGNRQIMLFDHHSDPNETVNVADENPTIVESMTAKIKELNRGFIEGLE